MGGSSAPPVAALALIASFWLAWQQRRVSSLGSRSQAGSSRGALPTGTSPFLDALTADGTTSSLQTSVAGVAAGKRKFLEERREQPFDKRLRFSVRQTESAYRYRDIVVRKQDGFTHILLSTKSSENNSLNPEVSH